MQRLFDMADLKGKVGSGPENAVRLFEGGKSMSAIRRMAPGEAGKAHFHPEADEWLICLEGDGEYYLSENQTTRIQAGQIGFAPAGAVHGVKNTGERDLVYIFFVGQPYKPSFVESGRS
jgi:oxalate decarboxylase